MIGFCACHAGEAWSVVERTAWLPAAGALAVVFGLLAWALSR